MSATARVQKSRQRLGDRVFANTTRVAGLLILVALAGVAIFLTVEGAPALGASSDSLDGASNFLAYVWPLVFGTLLAAVLALVIATPSRWVSRWSSRTTPLEGWPSPWATWSTCWPPYPASSTGCGAGLPRCPAQPGLRLARSSTSAGSPCSPALPRRPGAPS